MMNWWEKYVGIDFVSKGRSWSGVDCYGLLRLIYRHERGIELPALQGYESTRDHATMNSMIHTQPTLIGFIPVGLTELQAFDVLVIRQAGFDCHLGIVIDHRRIIHSEHGKMAVVEDFTRPHLRPRIREAWRYAI
ncbi:NlpC/P60 family protein [uncultured Desulfuromusa sp.]|uniref:C40 family peptidase n=1 Tax=uncultured Desulfuromusa sp. TaxID=219183 RepID=UPI002AA65355|nr:NlpC/P60 family protein [uncultured Desulfuromusa sp.]